MGGAGFLDSAVAARAVDRAATDSTDASDEFAKAERLGDVIICAQLQAEHTVELLRPGREHDDRHCGAGTELPADIAPVHVGQTEIEQHHVVPVRGESTRTGGRVLDGEALRDEALHDGFGNRSIVLDQQDLHRAILTREARSHRLRRSFAVRIG